jgi:hypothetical protein
MRRLRAVTALVAVCTVVSVLPAGAAPAPLDDADLEQAVLTPEEMPDEQWAEAAPGVIEPEPHTQANDIEGGWCGGATDGYAAGELHTTGSASTTLTKVVSPDEPYWFVWEQLRSFDETADATSVAQAKSFIATIKAAVAECPDGWTVSGGEIINSVTPQVVPWPKVGNQRLAVELTTAGDGVTDTTHVVYVRVANNVLSIHSRILPPDESLLRKIVKRAAKLLKDAAADA